MNNNPKTCILVAEDDLDDQKLVKDAFREAALENIQFVKNGEELMNYLFEALANENSELTPFPDLILLDLNMPKKDGRTALQEIKNHPKFKSIPVIVMTTSKAEEDICLSYDRGANSFVIKPSSFSTLVSIFESIKKYWLQLVMLPPHHIGTLSSSLN